MPRCAFTQVGEVGELSEIFQWKGDGVGRDLAGFTPTEKNQVAEEMSDVSGGGGCGPCRACDDGHTVVGASGLGRNCRRCFPCSVLKG